MPPTGQTTCSDSREVGMYIGIGTALLIIVLIIILL
jgi:hypothetical protein